VLDKNKKLIAIVSAGIKLDKYREFMAQLSLPEGSVTSMADHKNITLYRLPERKDVPPGTPHPSQYVQGIPVDSKEGFYEAIGKDNVSRIYAYKRLWLRDNEPPYLVVHIGVVKNAALHHANIQLVYNVALLGIASLFAMLLAWIAGNSILVDPLNKLVMATKRFGEGEMHVRTGLAHRKDELGRLGNSFDAMAAMLETKDFERRRAEEALRESEQRLQALMDAAPIAISWSDMEGDRKYINRRHHELFGYTLEDIPTKAEFHRRAYPDPAYRETIPSFIDASKQGKELVPYEATITCKNGTQRHVIVSATVVLNMLLIMFNDITERKQTERELHESEQRLQALMDAAPIAISWAGLEGKIKYCNRKFSELFGYALEDIYVVAEWRRLAYPDPAYRETIPSLVEAHKQGKELAPFEAVITCKDGSQRHAVVSGAVVANLALLILNDITERKRAEEAVRRSEALLHAVMKTTSDPVYVKDRQSRILMCNPALEKVVGKPAVEIIGKTDSEYYENPAIGQALRENDLRVMESGRSQSTEEVAGTSDGYRIFLSSKAPYRNESGEVIGIIGISHDITERKQAEEKIRASLKEKEVLLKEIHHRVKNNLQIISSLLFLQSSRTEHPGAVSALQESRARVKSMALIHERLYQSPDLASVDMGEYTRNLVSDLRHSYRTGDGLVRFTLNLEDIPLDIAEAIPCGLIINELVSNALKHAFPNGKKGEVTIQLQRGSANRVTLTVSDNGIGFPEHVDFHKSPSLGLTLVNSLIDQLDGTVELDRSGGTAFTITFG
jgi:PAS domain S-box-containing protein